jgi:hypothetical protein
MSTALLPLDSMRSRCCQLRLAALARAMLAALRGPGAQAATTAADGGAERGPSASCSRRP